MPGALYRYEFLPQVPLAEIETSIVLAILATECLHGAAQVRLDASHYLDDGQHACVIDASTDVGKDINRLFVGFLRREFGEDAFAVKRIDATDTAPLAAAA